jgi:hypothetical protein
MAEVLDLAHLSISDRAQLEDFHAKEPTAEESGPQRTGEADTGVL